jgi:HEAT repeat protein
MSDLSAQKILELLNRAEQDEQPRTPGKPDRLWYVQRWITRKADANELIVALEEATDPLLRQVLVQILWERCELAAVPAIIACLEDSSPEVRDVAADALHHLGDARAGTSLLKSFVQAGERHERRATLALALGSVGNRSAIPLLIEALHDSNGEVRAAAAWSLGMLGAREANDPLHLAFSIEADPWAKKDIEMAMTTIGIVMEAEDAADSKLAVSMLASALESASPQVRVASARTLSQFDSEEVGVLLERALPQEKICAVAQRLKEALIVVKSRNEHPV